MSLSVLHAFRNMAPRRDADRWYFEDPRARHLLELQILNFPSFALPDPENAVCVAGVVPSGGVGEVWMIAGQGFRRLAPVILGQGKGLCATMYEILKLHRMDIRCSAADPAAGLWARRMGFEYETTLRRAGARGNDLDVYLWPDERG